MDFQLSPDQERFRAELRRWLESNCPGDWGRIRSGLRTREAQAEFLIDWQRKLHAAGYVGLHWPTEYGGRGATVLEQVIFYEEMARARAPELPNAIGLDMAGPALIAHATEKQKQAHLPRILAADHIFCQGFSEPNAGSDLAAVQTRADRKNGYYVINGQKVWTSYAHYANWCILLTRTDATAPKHKGLTFFIVDMASPGLTVKPLRQMSGDAEFNELFFDNLEVPAENVVGRENGGWAVAITTLMFERGPRALSRQLILRQGIAELLELARARGRAGEPVTRQRLAQAYIEAEVLRYSSLRILTRMMQGLEPGPEGSVSKLFFSETWQRTLELGLELQGPYASLWQGSPRAVEDGWWQFRALRSRGDTIAGGTSEVMKNILAERVLGLPKD
jgi:alkylation response protein AidB-like acyl-CoA dehydrogenase